MNQVPLWPTRQDLIDALREATNKLEQAASAGGIIPYVASLAWFRAVINNAECTPNDPGLCTDREMRLSTLLAALSTGKATLHRFDRADFVGVMVGNLVYACDLDWDKAPVVSDRLLEALKTAVGPIPRPF